MAIEKEMIKFYTETECSICGVMDKREGAGEYSPPANWAEATLTYHLASRTGPDTETEEAILCPACAKKVFKMIWETKRAKKE